MNVTAINLSALVEHFAGAARATNRVSPTLMSHIRRCHKAGLLTVDGSELVLTPVGLAAVAGARAKSSADRVRA